MSNHPWRRMTHIFTCEPDCPERKPGCQDHCEKYIREKAEHDKRVSIENTRNYLDSYTTRRIMCYRDRKAKSASGGYVKKTDHTGR